MMMPPASINVVHCVVCDDIRLEVGNKETIVGVYSAGMTVPTLPWVVSTCLWMTVIWSGEGSLNVEVRIVNPRQTQAGETSGSANAIWQGQETTLTFRGLIFTIDMEGIYNIQWRTAGGAWETIRQFPVMPQFEL